MSNTKQAEIYFPGWVDLVYLGSFFIQFSLIIIGGCFIFIYWVISVIASVIFFLIWLARVVMRASQLKQIIYGLERLQPGDTLIVHNYVDYELRIKGVKRFKKIRITQNRNGETQTNTVTFVMLNN